MIDVPRALDGEHYFAIGKSYDLNQDKSPAAATLARAAFIQGASLGHAPSMRALAGLFYYGVGGERDPNRAFMLLWKAFQECDSEAVTELADMLADYSESIRDDEVKNIYVQAAQECESLHRFIERIEHFFQVRVISEGVGGVRDSR